MPKPASVPPTAVEIDVTTGLPINPVDVIDSAVPVIFKDLVRVILGGLTPLSLPDIVKVVFSELEHGEQEAIVLALQRRLNAQITRSAGNQMAHALTKAIDGIIDDPTLNLPQDQKNRLGEALATQAANELAKAAALLLAYPKFQEAVVDAKIHSGNVAEARNARSEQYSKFNAALVNVGRLLAGDAPK